MRRPASVTVFAIINLVFGAFGVVAFAGYLLNRFSLIPQPRNAPPNPIADAMAENAAFVMYNDLLNILSISVTVLLIAASIAMLKIKPWGRLVTLAWGWYALVIAVINVVVTHMIVFAPLIAAEGDPALRIGLRIGLVIMYVMAGLFVGYYLLMLAMLSRRKIRDAFNQPDLLMEPAA